VPPWALALLVYVGVPILAVLVAYYVWQPYLVRRERRQG